MLGHAYWPRDQLIDHQNRKVREIVKYAYEHSPFYNKQLKQLGLKPSDVQEVKDLSKLPILVRSELQRHDQGIVSDEFPIDNLQVERTSGSSGQPLSVYLSKLEHEFRMAKMLRANISCGQKARDKWLVITSPKYKSRQARIQRFLRVYSPVSMSVFDDPMAQLSTIEQFKPDVLESYSSSLVLLAREIEAKHLEPCSPRLIIGGAELIDDSSRRFVESVFGAPFFDQYASVELEAMAWQCIEKGGYHIDADSVVMEFVDEDGKEVAPGERGEILLTSLFNYAMPFIRYAIGDVGVHSDDECSCGRAFPLMKMIEGRKDSFMRFSDGRVLSPRSFTIAMSMFSRYDQIDRFRIIQKSGDVVEFVLKLKERVEDEEFFASSLGAHVKKMLKLEDSSVEVLVRFTDDISLSKGGKMNAVISECEP